MKNQMKKLTPKQLLFVDKYFELKFNGTKAYLQTYTRVKHSETAKTAASRLLTNVNVKQEVDRRQQEMRETNKELVDKIVDEVKNLAFSNIGNYLSFGPGYVTLKSSENMSPEQLAAVAEVRETVTEHGGSVSFKLQPKLKSLELLMRYHGLIVERAEQTGKDGVQLGEGMFDFGKIMDDIAASYVPGRLWNHNDPCRCRPQKPITGTQP